MLVAVTEEGFIVRLAVVLLNAAGATVTTPLLVAVLLATLKDLDLAWNKSTTR